MGRSPEVSSPRLWKYPWNQGEIQTCPSVSPGVGGQASSCSLSLRLAKEKHSGPAMAVPRPRGKFLVPLLLRQYWAASLPPVFSVLLWDGGSVLLAQLDGVGGCLGEASTGNICHGHFLASSLTLFPSTELEKQLVALIPYGDQRLKPRHTWVSSIPRGCLTFLFWFISWFFPHPGRSSLAVIKLTLPLSFQGLSFKNDSVSSWDCDSLRVCMRCWVWSLAKIKKINK